MTRKTIKSLVFLFAAALFVLGGCEKDKVYEQLRPTGQNMTTKNVNTDNDVEYGIDLRSEKISLRPNTQNISKLILNPSDSEDEKIHKYLYHLAWSVKDLMRSSEFNRTVIDIAKSNKNQVALLTETDSDLSGVIDFINDNLKKSERQKYPELNIDERSFSEIAEKFTYNYNGEIYEYNPGIFVFNIDNADPDKIPVFSCGIQADSDTDDSLEDLLIAWYYTEQGEIEEILLSEKEAVNMRNPLFILDNTESENNFKLSKKTDISNNIVEKKMMPELMAGKTYNVRKVRNSKINERYERTGDSEFWITAALINENGDTEYVLKEGSSYVLNKELKKVDKRDIGDYFDVNKQFCDDPTPYSSNYLYYNTYERDWYKSKKKIGEKHHSGWGTTIYLYGKMTYSHEWYSYTPDYLYRFNLDMGWNVRSNSKSYVRIIWYTY